jgi:hypothetical protein
VAWVALLVLAFWWAAVLRWLLAACKKVLWLVSVPTVALVSAGLWLGWAQLKQGMLLRLN